MSQPTERIVTLNVTINTELGDADLNDVFRFLLGLGDLDSVEVDISAVKVVDARLFPFVANPLRTAIRGLADGIEAGTTQFMADYEKAGNGISTRMSGESAALLVQARSELVERLRFVLASTNSTLDVQS